jgi:peptide deformylase
MAVREVIRMGHPVLRQTARQVDLNEIQTPEFKALLKDMYDTMKKEGGIGIAAPQIAESLQVTLIELESGSSRYPNMPTTGLLTIINPQIKVLSDEKQGFWEGCLSIPGLRGYVERPQNIQVDYLDENAKPQTVVLNDFLSTVFQHEIDHLFGILYPDRMSDMTKLSYVEEYQHFIQKIHE